MEVKSFFGGTAYLGMPKNEKFRDLVFEGIKNYGINFGASRNNNVTLDIYEVAETEASGRSEAEDSIIVSSGYLAAQLVIQHFTGKSKFIYAPDTHPALWIGQPTPPKVSFSEWKEDVINELNSSDQPVVLVTNSLNNIIPEIYDFDWLYRINPAQEVTLVVDDSHGIGITGKNGEGVYPGIPKFPNIEVIVIASMAKALGIDAGLILGTKNVIRKLRTSPVYAGASPPSPGLLFAYVNASAIYFDELEKLRSNMKFFTSLIEDSEEMEYINDFPVYLLKDEDLTEYLRLNEILISSFAYPDPKGNILNRIVLNSSHSKEELRRLVSIILERKR